MNPKSFLEVGRYLHTSRHRDELWVRYVFGRMEGEAESVWEGLRNAVYRLRTRGLSIYDPTHSWPDSASVVDGVRGAHPSTSLISSSASTGSTALDEGGAERKTSSDSL